MRPEKVVFAIFQALLGIGLSPLAFASSQAGDECHWHDGAYALAAQFRAEGISRSDAVTRVWEAVADEKASAAVALVQGSDVMSAAERAKDKAEILEVIQTREPARNSVDLLSDKILRDVYVEWTAKSPAEVVDSGYKQCKALVACQSEADTDGCVKKVLGED